MARASQVGQAVLACPPALNSEILMSAGDLGELGKLT
jgi:hypothetical protein